MISLKNTSQRTLLPLGVTLSLIGLIFLGCLGLRMKTGPDTRSEDARSLNAATSLSVVKAAALSAPQADSTETDQVPKGLTASDWSSIKREYERHRHAAFPVKGPIKSGGAPAWQARNHSQQWLTHFDGRGFAVEPDGANWRWGLELQSYGFPGRQRAVSGRARVSVETDRVAYDWDGAIEEWFVNDRRGLEHGFTLRERLGGEAGADEKLELRLAVRGGLRPQAQADGRGVSFVGADGGVVVNYAGLKVWDADGRELAARFEAVEDKLRLTVEESDARYPLTIDPIAQQAYLKASNTEAYDYFGYSVAISGDTVVVGAVQEDSNATGVNGNQSDNSAYDSGAAYVFVRSGATWSQQAYLKASNTEASDYYGYSVAISGDTVVVTSLSEDSNATGVNGDQSDNSASQSGAAYVLVRSGTTWSQQAYLKASNTGVNDRFGYSAAISGETVVVGAYLEASNATGVNGDQSDNSASESGAAYVFARSGTTWSQQAYLKASNTGADDRFGHSVAISGDTVVVGAVAEASNATGVNGNQSDNSAGNSGATYIFVRNGTSWSQQAYLKASNTEASDYFGYSVAISGETVVVGTLYEGSNATGVNGDQSNNSASQSGAVYVFVRSGTTWSQQAYLKASNSGAYDYFGYSVAIFSEMVVVGAYGEASNATGVNGNQSDNSAYYAGAAYVFVRSGTTWSQQAYLKASNTGESDLFGWSVAISGETVVVGAFVDDSNATGVNGDQSDNSAGASGAAYVFTTPQGQATSLIAQVQALVTGGTLPQNKANVLINKLEQVIAKLNEGQTNAACGQLGAFINQVNAFINNGSLTPAQGQALIDGANAIKTNIGC